MCALQHSHDINPCFHLRFPLERAVNTHKKQNRARTELRVECIFTELNKKLSTFKSVYFCKLKVLQSESEAFWPQCTRMSQRKYLLRLFHENRLSKLPHSDVTLIKRTKNYF